MPCKGSHQALAGCRGQPAVWGSQPAGHQPGPPAVHHSGAKNPLQGWRTAQQPTERVNWTPSHWGPAGTVFPPQHGIGWPATFMNTFCWKQHGKKKLQCKYITVCPVEDLPLGQIIVYSFKRNPPENRMVILEWFLCEIVYICAL